VGPAVELTRGKTEIVLVVMGSRAANRPQVGDGGARVSLALRRRKQAQELGNTEKSADQGGEKSNVP